jgi:UDP-glucuronate decarboxylase
MRRFLLIGGAGTVGRNLQHYLTRQNEISESVDFIYHDEKFVDILDSVSLEKAFSNFHPTHVILLAASVGRVFNSLDHHNSLMTNVMGAYNVIQACLANKCKLTYVGTSESYGSRFNSSPNYPTDEFSVPMDFPIFHGIYGFTKLVAEKLVEHYTLNHGLSSSVVRLFMCYAADGSTANHQTAISRMFRSAMMNGPIEVHKDTSRSWCYVTDIVKGIYLVALKGDRLYNIGNPNENISSEDLAQKIIDLTGSKSDLNLIEPDPDIYRHKKFNIRLAESAFGFTPVVTLDEGLKCVHQTYLK